MVAVGFVLSGVALGQGLAQDRIDHCVALGSVVLAKQDWVTIRPTAEAAVPQSDRCTKIIAADSLTFTGVALALADPAKVLIRDAYPDPGHDPLSVVAEFCLSLDPSRAQQVACGLWH